MGTPQLSPLLTDVCHIIDGTRQRAATYLNTEVCITNWYIGERIKEDVLNNQRAAYGRQIIKQLSAALTERYGRGWSEKALRHCLRCAETFSKDEIVSATQRQLTWTHVKTLSYVKDNLARAFYMEMCHIEHWDTRTLDEDSPIKVAQYYTTLPDKTLLAEKLQRAIAIARETCQKREP